jgi:hypothetical protein
VAAAAIWRNRKLRLRPLPKIDARAVFLAVGSIFTAGWKVVTLRPTKTP